MNKGIGALNLVPSTFEIVKRDPAGYTQLEGNGSSWPSMDEWLSFEDMQVMKTFYSFFTFTYRE